MPNFKKKIFVLFAIGSALLFSNSAMAYCTMSSPRDFTLNMGLRGNPGSSAPLFTINCTTATTITPRRDQPLEWANFVTIIRNQQKHHLTGELLPEENIMATFRARIAENSSGAPPLHEWNFNMARSNIITGSSASYTLQPNVNYVLTVDLIDGTITPHPNQPLGLSVGGQPNASAYLYIADSLPWTVSGRARDTTPPVTPTCTASAFTVTVPSTVEFDSMDEDSLKAGHEYKKSFSIVVVKKPNQGCKNTTTPSVTFSAASATSGQPYAKIPERGLLLSIYQGRTKAILDFGVRSDLAVQSGTSIVTEAYEGRIKKDIYAKVTPGPFSTTVTYAMSYR